MKVCVFCSSSDALDASYVRQAEALGTVIGDSCHQLIYGGGRVGLMGTVARAVHAAGGFVTGVIPQALHEVPNIAYPEADELIVTSTLRERKQIMDDRADAFVALPGGIGTFEEVLEALTLKQLGYHSKPIVLLNTNDFFAPLLDSFQRMVDEQFAKNTLLELFACKESAQETLHYIEAYQAPTLKQKWF